MGVWDVRTGKRVWTLANNQSWTNFPVFARDGKTLVNTTAAGAVFVYDLQTGATRRLNPSHNGNITALAWSADGKRLAAASYLSEVFVWDIESAMPRYQCVMTPAYDPDTGKSPWAFAVKLAFAPDDKLVLAQELDRTVRLFAPHRGSEVRAFRAAGHVWDFTDNGKHLLWTGVRFNELQRADRVPPQVKADDLSYWLGAARWVAYAAVFPELDPFRCRAYVSADVYKEPPPLSTFLGEASGTAASPIGMSPDGAVVVEWIMKMAGRFDTGMGPYWTRDSMRFSDAFTGQEILRTKELGVMGEMLFAPDSRSFVALSREPKDSLRMIETRTGKERLRIKAELAQSGGCAFSRDGRWLAFVNPKHDIEIFDVTRGQIAATLASEDSGVRLVFSPDGSLLASGGNSGTILLWDLNAVLKREFKEPVWTEVDKDRLWSDLASADAAAAFAAMCKLKRSPKPAIELIRDRLQWSKSSKELDAWIERLGSSDFATRKKAHDAIEQLGERARPVLARALPEAKSVEHKRRVQALLAQLERPFTTANGLRLLRVIEVLDGLRTAEAAALLREMATDVPPNDPLGREIVRALERAR
jgi:WD40 repeat protein